MFDMLVMSRVILSVINGCVLKRIPRKGITSANEKRLKMVESILKMILSDAYAL